MNEKDWKILVLLKKEQNISHVARKLYFSQPALSSRIKAMEKELGCTLIERHQNGVTLTKNGETVAAYAAESLRTLNGLKEDLSNASGKLTGTLKIGCSNSVGELYLPAIFKRFKALHPEIDLNVNACLNDPIYADLLNGRIHIGLMRGDYPWGGTKLYLYSDPFCLVSSSPIILSQLPEQPGIFFSAEPQYNNAVNDWWSNTFNHPPRVSMTVSTLNVGLQMVEKGLGYSILTRSRLIDKDYLYSMDLTINGRTLSRDICIYLSKIAEKNNAALCFFEFMRDNYAKER